MAPKWRRLRSKVGVIGGLDGRVGRGKGGGDSQDRNVPTGGISCGHKVLPAISLSPHYHLVGTCWFMNGLIRWYLLVAATPFNNRSSAVVSLFRGFEIAIWGFPLPIQSEFNLHEDYEY